MKNIISQIHKDLKANVDLEYKKSSEKFWREKINILGVRTPKVKEIGIKYFSQIKKLPKEEIMKLCEALMDSGYGEMKHMAFWWAFRIKKQLVKNDFKTFEFWIKKYVTSWDLCDNFCTHSVNAIIEMYPELISKIKSWTKSKNRWFRRASAVTFVPSARKGRFHKEIFEIAYALLKDKDDMVQKGYGWMLKEASNSDCKAVFNFVMKHKKEMPRIALRYAVEKLPQDLIKKAMQK